jgi:hypothetical protein
MNIASRVISMILALVFALSAIAQEQGDGRPFQAASLEDVHRIEKQADSTLVDSLRRAAAKGDELFPNEADAVEEELATGGFGEVSQWGQYCKEFRVKVFKPRLELDMSKDVVESIKTPLDSVTLYMRTWYTGNKTLRNRFSDASMRKEDGKIADSKLPRTDLSKIVLLYTASKTWNGHSYMFVKFRRQHPTAPSDNCFWFGGLCLKKTKEGYIWTHDLAWSQIGICPSTPWIYKTERDMVAELKNTDLPKSFYTLTKRK